MKDGPFRYHKNGLWPLVEIKNVFIINIYLNNFKLSISCMVEPAEGEEDNDDDDKAHNDHIHIAVLVSKYQHWK